jgi:hypothetical protein
MKIGKVKATFDKDSRKFHRFNIDENDEGIVGMIYFPRDGEGIPDEVTITLETKAKGE